MTRRNFIMAVGALALPIPAAPITRTKLVNVMIEFDPMPLMAFGDGRIWKVSDNARVPFSVQSIETSYD